MKKSNNTGFTLIELLVVIAIIGLLSAIILAALSSAQNKGNDGAVKSDIDSARSQAELYYYANNNSYAGVCTGSVGAVKGINASLIGAGKALGGSPVVGALGQAFVYGTNSGTAGVVVCHDGAAGWAAIVSLHNPTTANSGWCADSVSGVSKESTVLSANSLVCGQ